MQGLRATGLYARQPPPMLLTLLAPWQPSLQRCLDADPRDALQVQGCCLKVHVH